MEKYVREFGEVELKKNIDILELRNELDSFNISYRINPGCIGFLGEGSYSEKDTLEFLDILSPYIKKGTINYSNDKDKVWKFIFDPKTKMWKQEFGTIDYNFNSYTDEQMIKELIERGYAVSKIYSENRDYEWIVCQNDDGDVDITRFIGTKDEVKEHLLRIIQFGRSRVEQREFEINSVGDLRVIRGGWRVFAKEKYDEGAVEYSAIEVNHIFTT